MAGKFGHTNTSNLDSDLSSSREQDNDDTTTHVAIGKEETKAVSAFRLVLLVSLLAVAICISVGAYFLARYGEQEDFENTFESHANKVSWVKLAWFPIEVHGLSNTSDLLINCTR
jgi:hypothetical protein